MAKIPLYTPPPHPDGWHRVTAPGGYETWHFDVESADGQIRLIAGLHLGWPQHWRYVKRYAQYRAWPTRVRPPLPGEFPLVTIQLEQPNRPDLWIANEFDETEFSANADSLQVRIGSSHVARRADGAVQLCMRGRRGSTTLAADLLFRAVFAATYQWIAAAHHLVMLVDPLCAVEGQVQVFDTSRSEPPTVLPLVGRGVREHRVGLRSLVDARGPIANAWRIDNHSLILSRRIGVHDKHVMMSEGSIQEPAALPEGLLDDKWRSESIVPQVLRWPVVGRWLGPRVTRG